MSNLTVLWIFFLCPISAAITIITNHGYGTTLSPIHWAMVGAQLCLAAVNGVCLLIEYKKTRK